MGSRVTFTIHGLDADNKLVRADVFLRKLNFLMRGLHIADKSANGSEAHEYIIQEMRVSSALVQVREKPKGRKIGANSSIEAYSGALRAVYDGQAQARKVPQGLVATFKGLSVGSDKKFQHAELDFDSSNLIRIDDYLLRQSEKALSSRGSEKMIGEKFFRGVAMGTFDGYLRVMDSRGQLLRATLVTTAGGKEIDCIVQKDRVDELAQHFEHRVRIEGLAHYDSESALPLRVDVKSIRPIKKDADLKRWKGAFVGSAAMREDW